MTFAPTIFTSQGMTHTAIAQSRVQKNKRRPTRFQSGQDDCEKSTMANEHVFHRLYLGPPVESLGELGNSPKRKGHTNKEPWQAQYCHAYAIKLQH